MGDKVGNLSDKNSKLCQLIGDLLDGVGLRNSDDFFEDLEQYLDSPSEVKIFPSPDEDEDNVIVIEFYKGEGWLQMKIGDPFKHDICLYFQTPIDMFIGTELIEGADKIIKNTLEQAQQILESS